MKKLIVGGGAASEITLLKRFDPVHFDITNDDIYLIGKIDDYEIYVDKNLPWNTNIDKMVNLFK